VLMLFVLVCGVHAQSARPTGNIRPGAGDTPRPQQGLQSERPARIIAPAVPAPVQGTPLPPSTPSPGGAIDGPPLWNPPVLFTPVIVVQDPVCVDCRPPVRPVGKPEPEEIDRYSTEALPFEVHLRNRAVQPALAGYNFLDDKPMPWDHQETDLYFESSGETASLSAPSDTRIVDVGMTETVQDIGGMPGSSGSGEGRAEAHQGHGYVVRLWDRTLIGVRVTAVSREDLRFEWLPIGKDPVGVIVSFPR